MPSITIPTSTGPRWGDSAFNSSTAALKVGKSGTATYYGYVGFPTLNPAWTIKSITFKMNRTDSYSTKVLQFGSSTSNTWGSKGTQDWKADFSVASGTGTKSWSLTAYKDILQGYTGTWYLHVQHGSGTNSYCEFNGGTGSTSPRLVVEYEDSSLTVPGDQLTIGVQSTITVGNLNSGLTHKVSYAIGSASGALSGGEFITAGSAVNWMPDTALANQITDDMVGDITFTLENYSGGVFQSSRTLTFPLNVPASFMPTISSAPFTLQNPTGDTIGVYVQNRSWTKCTVTAASVYGASIVEYRLTIGGVTYSSSTNVITTGVLAQYGVLSGTVTVVDSRGQTATYLSAAAVTVYQYFSPIITAFSVMRCTSGGVVSNTGTYIKYVMTVSFAPINNLNVRAGTLKFKLASGAYGSSVGMSAIPSYSATVTGIIGGAITSAAYVVSASLTDKYSTTTVEVDLASSKIWFDLHSSGEGMAIGGEAAVPSVFDVYLPSRFRGSVVFNGAPTYTAPSAAIANLFPCCRLSNPTGDTISYNADNRRAWVLNFSTITRCDNGLYEILMGGSGATRQMGWVIPMDGIYRVILAFRASTNTSDGHIGIARLPNTWTPPSANYMLRDTMLGQQIEGTSQYVSRLTTSTGNLSGNMTYDFPANAGDKIWPWLCMLDANKTLLSDETWASIQKIG